MPTAEGPRAGRVRRAPRTGPLSGDPAAVTLPPSALIDIAAADGDGGVRARPQETDLGAILPADAVREPIEHRVQMILTLGSVAAALMIVFFVGLALCIASGNERVELAKTLMPFLTGVIGLIAGAGAGAALRLRR